MQDSKKDSQDSKIVFRITRGIASALTAPTRDPVAEYVQEFCARSKDCISQMHRTAVVSICQWIDASIATASAPSHVLYQGIPAAVIQGLVMYMDITNTRSYSGSGNTVYNLVNGGIAGTIVSGITYDTDNRKNLNFNGSSGYMVSNNTSMDFSTSDFTIQTPLKLNGLSNGFTGAYGSVICAGAALTNNSSIFQNI